MIFYYTILYYILFILCCKLTSLGARREGSPVTKSPAEAVSDGAPQGIHNMRTRLCIIYVLRNYVL